MSGMSNMPGTISKSQLLGSKKSPSSPNQVKKLWAWRDGVNAKLMTASATERIFLSFIFSAM